MRLRCHDPKHKHYPDYGARGITVCDRWRNDPRAFLADMGPKPSPAHEIDRHPDNNGNYEPGNCRWVLRSANCRNRRSNRMLDYRGETLTMIEWCERLSMPEDTVRARLEAGWSVERALDTPVRAKARNGEAKKHTQPCVDCGDEAFGTRCRPCENRRRPRNDDTGVFTGSALCAAALEGA